MRHRFYNKTKREQNSIQLFIGFCALSILVLAFLISWITGFYLLGVLIFIIALSIIAPFFDTPSLKKNGDLVYHSSLFLSEKPKNGIIQIHGGTLFDYFFVIDQNMDGRRRIHFIIHQYLEGLLNLLEENKNRKTGNLLVRGTSYIINERTAHRIGFMPVKTNTIQKLILIYNYFNVLIMYSMAKGKLSFPKVNDTKTFEADLNGLLKPRASLSRLNEKLKNKITNS